MASKEQVISWFVFAAKDMYGFLSSRFPALLKEGYLYYRLRKGENTFDIPRAPPQKRRDLTSSFGQLTLSTSGT